MDKEKLIEIIKVIKRDFIHSAIESIKANERVREEDKKFPTISNFNIKNIDNLSLLCRNIFYMKKWYDDATPFENRHNRTLTYEYELLGGLILAGYELDLYDPLSKEDNNKENSDENFNKEKLDNQVVNLENSIINKETENILLLFISIYKHLKNCKDANMGTLECCEILQGQFNSISCISNISYYDWFMSFFSRKKKYENKYLKYKKKIY
jgi:hypothetical protein